MKTENVKLKETKPLISDSLEKEEDSFFDSE